MTTPDTDNHAENTQKDTASDQETMHLENDECIDDLSEDDGDWDIDDEYPMA